MAHVKLKIIFYPSKLELTSFKDKTITLTIANQHKVKNFYFFFSPFYYIYITVVFL